jgi:hypothetical protein
MQQAKITKTDQKVQPKKTENTDCRTAAAAAPQTCTLLDFYSVHKWISAIMRYLSQMRTGVSYLYCFCQAVWADFSFWVLKTQYKIFFLADFSFWVLKTQYKLFFLADFSFRVMSKSFRVSLTSWNILISSKVTSGGQYLLQLP